MEMDIDLIAEKAVDHFGAPFQIWKSLEEMGELIVALAKAPPLVSENIIDEIADVQIMIRQLRIIYGATLVDERIEYKLNRLMKRMEK